MIETGADTAANFAESIDDDGTLIVSDQPSNGKLRLRKIL